MEFKKVMGVLKIELEFVGINVKCGLIMLKIVFFLVCG